MKGIAGYLFVFLCILTACGIKAQDIIYWDTNENGIRDGKLSSLKDENWEP